MSIVLVVLQEKKKNEEGEEEELSAQYLTFGLRFFFLLLIY